VPTQVKPNHECNPMLHILLAEDNAGDVLLVRQALQEHSIWYELQVVRDGEEALAAVAHLGEPGEPPSPDLGLLDLNLPKVDGPEVLSEFRKHPGCAHTPVVVISSSDARRDRDRMAEMGVNHYFRKPSNFDDFMQLGAVVRTVVGESLEPSGRSPGQA
jgi:chemotaxis family two-component system response regulator Rcp1